MNKNYQRTILLSIPYWRAVTGILRTEIFSLLKKEGFRIVILSPFSKNKDFIGEFSGENIFFEAIEEINKNSVLELSRRTLSFLGLTVNSFLSESIKYFIAQSGTAVLDLRNVEFKNNKLLNYLGKGAFLAGRFFLMILGVSIGMFFKFFLKIKVLTKNFIFYFWDKINYQLIFKSHKKYIAPIFAKYRPDLICASRMFFCYIENLIITMSQIKRIPSVGIYTHLDGIVYPMTYNSAYRIPRVNKLLVWSEIVKKEMVNVHNFKEEDVVATGCPVHDIYFNFLKKRELLPREEFFEKMGFDKRRKLLILANPILFSLTEETFGAYWCEIINYIVNCVSQDRFVYPCQLFIRLHPTNSINLYHFLKNKFGSKENIFITLPGKSLEENSEINDGDMTRDDLEHFAEILTYSDVIILGRSGVAIDAAIFNIPMVAVINSKRVDIFEKYVFPAIEVFDPGAFVQRVNNYLINPSLDSEERRRIVKELCGEVDGNASKRIIEVIKSMC
jgi:hypothetical protein